MRTLFSGEVVEEKIDGKFIYKEVGDYIIFHEYMRIRHEIHYIRLPCYETVFDVYNIKMRRFPGVPENMRY